MSEQQQQHGHTVTGKVLSVTNLRRDHPVTNERTGEVQGAYHYDRLRLLVHDQVLDVKADHLGESDYGPRSTWDGPLPEVGQTVSIRCEVGAYKDRTSGRAQVTYRGLSLASPARPAAVPTPRAS